MLVFNVKHQCLSQPTSTNMFNTLETHSCPQLQPSAKQRHTQTQTEQDSTFVRCTHDTQHKLKPSNATLKSRLKKQVRPVALSAQSCLKPWAMYLQVAYVDMQSCANSIQKATKTCFAGICKLQNQKILPWSHGISLSCTKVGIQSIKLFHCVCMQSTDASELASELCNK